MNTRPQNRIYLDHASSTPIDPSVLDILLNTSKEIYGNSSSLHHEGVMARELVHDCKKKIAYSIGAHSDEIIFTSGGTESDNLALLGVLEESRKLFVNDEKPHIIISTIEHAAIYETALFLEKKNKISLSFVPVSEKGLVDVEVLKKELKRETVFISVMHANNEIGTVQPIKEIAKIIRHFKKNNRSISNEYPVFHSDACQSFVYEYIQVESLGVDLLSINASKIYGPKGIGALYKKRNVRITPMILGGEQEFRLRAGTENVPLIASFAQAIVVNESLKNNESERLKVLQNYFFQELKNNFKVRIHGSEENRLPNNINVSFIGYKAEIILLYLDAEGISVSEKSACKSDNGESSHVIKALYGDTSEDTQNGSIRFSMGRTTTKEDIDIVIKSLSSIFILISKI